GQGSGLQRSADFVFESGGLALRVEAADRNAAAIEVAQALKDLDRGGLSCSVRAEQAEDFAFLDVEADTADGQHVAVVLNEIFYLEDGGCHRQSPHSLGLVKERIAYRRRVARL